jgi:hypothetical protein
MIRNRLAVTPIAPTTRRAMGRERGAEFIRGGRSMAGRHGGVEQSFLESGLPGRG